VSALQVRWWYDLLVGLATERPKATLGIVIGVLAVALLPWLSCRMDRSGRFTVSGRVTFAGKPVPNGRIVFEPDATAGVRIGSGRDERLDLGEQRATAFNRDSDAGAGYRCVAMSAEECAGVRYLAHAGVGLLEAGDFIGVRDLRFTRLIDGQPIEQLLPEETAHSMVPVLTLNGLTITVNLGARDDVYTYTGGGRIELGPIMKLNVGTSPMEHYYINGGSATVVGPLELNGELTNAEGATLSYNNADLKPRAGSVYAIA